MFLTTTNSTGICVCGMTHHSALTSSITSFDKEAIMVVCYLYSTC